MYEGTCGNLICVAGNDDQSETTGFDDLCPVAFVASTVTMHTALGSTYFALVSGVVGESGDFEIGLSCTALGCTDPTACNYEATAEEENGSCDYCSCVEEEASGYSLALETQVSHTEIEELAGMSTYRMYITTPNANDAISSIYGTDEEPLVISTTTSFFQSEAGGTLGSGINPFSFHSYHHSNSTAG